MTYETFEKAQRIDYDIHLLGTIVIPEQMSNETTTALKKWIGEYKEKLEKEFNEL